MHYYYCLSWYIFFSSQYYIYGCKDVYLLHCIIPKLVNSSFINNLPSTFSTIHKTLIAIWIIIFNITTPTGDSFVRTKMKCILERTQNNIPGGVILICILRYNKATPNIHYTVLCNCVKTILKSWFNYFFSTFEQLRINTIYSNYFSYVLQWI